ncbi:MAG: hypothetical protein ACI4PW_03640 [Alphaproteobacteria bacterium]
MLRSSDVRASGHFARVTARGMIGSNLSSLFVPGVGLLRKTGGAIMHDSRVAPYVHETGRAA